MYDHDALASASNRHDLGPRARRRSSAALEPPADFRRKSLPSIRTSIEESSLRFACPYSKKSPAEQQKQRSCVYPGFSTIHRLKEHLYRYHMLPALQCPRCDKRFDDEPGLRTHQRSTVPCELGEVPKRNFSDGFDAEQKKNLKKRARSKADEDKWRDIYHTLFPDDEKTPWPYHQDKKQNGLDDFHDFCHQQSARVLQHKLNASTENSLLGRGQLLQTGLLNLMHEVHDQLFEDFQSHLEESSYGSLSSSANTSRSVTPATPYSFNDGILSPMDDTQGPPRKKQRFQAPAEERRGSHMEDRTAAQDNTFMTAPEILISPAPSPALTSHGFAPTDPWQVLPNIHTSDAALATFGAGDMLRDLSLSPLSPLDSAFDFDIGTPSPQSPGEFNFSFGQAL